MAERNAELDHELAQLIERLEKLRVVWDRYFMGLERTPPLSDRDRLARSIRQSRLGTTHKTTLKFRYANLQQRFNTYNQHWERCMRMIEEGTFKRERGQGLSAAYQAEGQQRQSKKDPMRRLYEDWRAAGREAGSAKDMDFRKFSQRMEAQRARHIAKFGCDDINYAVRVKGGKVALVAKPIRK